MSEREWSGAPVLSHGFRPFFLAATIWAVVAMALWILMIGGVWLPPTAFDIVSWHAHAFLIGYLGAVLGGFLLTAVPNWTGRLPVRGMPLAGLLALWAVGRVAVLTSMAFPGWLVMVLDLGSLAALAGFLGREIVAGRNWKNLPVLALLVTFIAGGVLFHLDHWRGETPVHGAGFRVMLSMAIMMIALIGGKIIPSFTRNWLSRQGWAARPAPPMQRFDVVALVLLLVALLAWTLGLSAAGPALIVAGVAHVVRLARWQGHRTVGEPLLVVLHVAYALMPAGAIFLGWALWTNGDIAGPLHVWTAGTIGLMTLAVMTRASLGHTGHALRAGPATVAIYSAMMLAVGLRLAAGTVLGSHVAFTLSGVFWIVAFGLFVAAYGPVLLRPRLGT